MLLKKPVSDYSMLETIRNRIDIQSIVLNFDQGELQIKSADSCLVEPEPMIFNAGSASAKNRKLLTDSNQASFCSYDDRFRSA